MPSRVTRSIALCLVATSVMAAGCVRAPAQVSSVWPIATAEATMSAPLGLEKYPLSGQPIARGSSASRVPVCAIVHDGGPNGPIGVTAADAVYETADAGSGTQLACLFQSGFPVKAGPVGTAGMPDLWVVPQYHAMLFSAGATSSLAASIHGWPGYTNASRDVGPPFDSAYQGTNVLPRVAAGIAAKYGSTVTSGPPSRLEFSASSGSTTTPISAVSVPFSASQVTSWSWDRKSGSYLRSVNGVPRADLLTGRRISARNIVVMWVRYTPLDSDIAGGGGFDVTLGGSGQVSVFRDGQRLDGRWKADGQSPPRFTTEDGASIRLGPGNTWVEAIPLSANITLK